MCVADISDVFWTFQPLFSKLDVYKRQIEQLEEYLHIVAQFNCGKDTLIMEYILNDEKDIAMMKDWLHKITHRTYNDETLKN